MFLERILGDISTSIFMDQHYTIRPFSLPGGAAEFTSFATWDTLESILSNPDADVMVVRQGRRWEKQRVPTLAEAGDLFDSGYTLLVRHAEQHDPHLAEMARQVVEDFCAPVNIHFYCTPAGEYGFGWHYDAEDVFILQTAGKKEYSLRKNTVNPWPVLETIPADMKYEREIMPLMKCLLAAGDWLYIPKGYWHAGFAKENSISLAIGVLAPTPMNVLEHLRRQLLSSMLWRQPLPAAGAASMVSSEELIEQYKNLFADLATDISQLLTSENFLRSFLRSGNRQSEGNAVEQRSLPPGQSLAGTRGCVD